MRLCLLALTLLCGCVVSGGDPPACTLDADCEASRCGAGGCECAAGACLPRCGNGRLDVGESCDDGAREAEDGCSPDCLIEQCGDGIIQARRGEACEPPGRDGCSASCTLSRCGDGLREGDEPCEPGPSEPACDPQRCDCLARDLTPGYDWVVALRSDGALLWFGHDPPSYGGAPVSLGPGRPAVLAPRAPEATRVHSAVFRKSLLLLEGDGAIARLLEPADGPKIGPDDGLLPAPAGERWVEAGGGDVFFALRTDAGRVFVVSDGSAVGPGAAAPRTLVELPGRYAAIATGLGFVILLDASGTVHTVGSSTTGALGLGGRTTADAPTRLEALSSCDRVSAAWQTSYARCDAPAAGCGDGSDELGPRSTCTGGWFAAGLHGAGLSGIGDALVADYDAGCRALGLEPSCVPRPHRLEEASARIEGFWGSTVTAFGLEPRGHLFALGRNFRGASGEHGNAHGIPDLNGGDFNEVNQDRPKGVPGMERGVARAVATWFLTSFVLLEDGRVLTAGEGCALPNGLGVLASRRLDATDACHPTVDTCFVDAELFTPVSLCEAAVAVQGSATLSCGQP